MHDLLLHDAFLLLQLRQLLLHVVVLVALGGDLPAQVVEVAHNKRVQHLHVLVVQRRQLVLHYRNVLPQRFNFLLVFSENNTGSGDLFLGVREGEYLDFLDAHFYVGLPLGHVPKAVRRGLLHSLGWSKEN